MPVPRLATSVCPCLGVGTVEAVYIVAEARYSCYLFPHSLALGHIRTAFLSPAYITNMTDHPTRYRGPRDRRRRRSPTPVDRVRASGSIEGPGPDRKNNDDDGDADDEAHRLLLPGNSGPGLHPCGCGSGGLTPPRRQKVKQRSCP